MFAWWRKPHDFFSLILSLFFISLSLFHFLIPIPYSYSISISGIVLLLFCFCFIAKSQSVHVSDIGGEVAELDIARLASHLDSLPCSESDAHKLEGCRYCSFHGQGVSCTDGIPSPSGLSHLCLPLLVLSVPGRESATGCIRVQG